MSGGITGATALAGVVGAPVAHSLSPLIHNAWLAASGIDAVYLAFAPVPGRFEAFVDGLRGGVVKGLNVTAPFKERALALSDGRSSTADESGAANLLLFAPDGKIFADNTDGQGILAALSSQNQFFATKAIVAVILGAGGAARGAAAALLNAGADEIRIVNRGLPRALQLCKHLGPNAKCFPTEQIHLALTGADVLINAASPAHETDRPFQISLTGLPKAATVMDMTYRPLLSPLLKTAAAEGLRTVDGLAMLIGQAKPSFEALFGVAPPPMDIRSVALTALQEPA